MLGKLKNNRLYDPNLLLEIYKYIKYYVDVSKKITSGVHKHMLENKNKQYYRHHVHDYLFIYNHYLFKQMCYEHIKKLIPGDCVYDKIQMFPYILKFLLNQTKDVFIEVDNTDIYKKNKKITNQKQCCVYFIVNYYGEKYRFVVTIKITT